MENAEKRAAEGMSAEFELKEEVKQTEIRSREAIRVAAKIAWQKREEEEARALVRYSQNVKKIAEAKRVRAINKGRALEQAEREAAYAARQGSVPTVAVTTTSDVSPLKRTNMFSSAMQSIVNGIQSMFLDRAKTTEKNPLKEGEDLAIYQRKIKGQQQANAVINARSKGQAIETAEQLAMRSKMLREALEEKARMEEEEDRLARATILRRKEAEEAAAAVAYAKSIKRLDEAKRLKANNKLKAMEEAEVSARQSAPSITPQFVQSTSTTDPNEAQARRILNAIIGVETAPAPVISQAAAVTTQAVATTNEAAALAQYAMKVKAQRQAAEQKSANIKAKTLAADAVVLSFADTTSALPPSAADPNEAQARRILNAIIGVETAPIATPVISKAAAVTQAVAASNEAAALAQYAMKVKKQRETAAQKMRQPPVVSNDAVVLTFAAPLAPVASTTNAAAATEAENLALYAKKINPTKIANSATSEEEALALYKSSLKSQQQSAAQKNARSKGLAMESAEQVAMKSKMLHEELEAQARMEAEEDRQARATAVRRKEAEEASAAISYAKTVKRLDEARRLKANNKLKALEQAGEYVRQPAPSNDAVVLTLATTTSVAATAAATAEASTYTSVATSADQEALAMYAKKINPTKIANSATSEEEALALYKSSLKSQQQSAAQKNARSKGLAMESAEQVAMKSKMLHEELEAKARMEEDEDRRALATAARRKEAEEASAAISYAKTVKRLDEARRLKANNKLKALEQAGEYVRQPAPSIASQFVLSTSTTDPNEAQARRILNAIIGVEAGDKAQEVVRVDSYRMTKRLNDMQAKTSERVVETKTNLKVSESEKATPQKASRTVMDFVVSALKAVQKLVRDQLVNHQS